MAGCYDFLLSAQRSPISESLVFCTLTDQRVRQHSFRSTRTAARVINARAHLAAKGLHFSVAVNAPFAGALVPIAYYQKDRRVLSVMIEINRRLYMDEQTGRKRQDFILVRDSIRKLIEAVADVFGSR